MNKEEASQVVEILKDKNVKVDTQTWNRRYREYMEKIKTGSVVEIAQVLRDLYILKVDKELSFGEFIDLDTLMSKKGNDLVLTDKGDQYLYHKKLYSDY